MMLHDTHETPLFSEFDAIKLHRERFGSFRLCVFGCRRCVIRGRNCGRHSGIIHPHEMSDCMLLATPAVLSAVTTHPTVVTSTDAASASAVEVIFVV